jgi:hypothetical protein
MLFLTEIIEHLGIHKNPLFLFVLISAKLIYGEAERLLGRSELWIRGAGMVMEFIPVILILGAGIFYIWALSNLPGSEQELEFEHSSEKVLKKHGASRRRRAV